MTGRLALPYAAGALLISLGLFAWQGQAYINYGEGVYLFSARMVLEGAVPYRDFIAAHPPLLFYTGAGILGIADSLAGARAILALVQVLTGALVALCVWRLTASRWAAVVAGWLSLLAPWTLHEHATLMPETLGAPLVMGAAVLAARRRTVAWAGIVAGTAIGVKWPFILAGLFLVAVVEGRIRFLVAFLLTFAVGVALSFAQFGAGLYDQLVTAQQQVGWYGVREFGGLAVQAAWNLGPLLVCALPGILLARSAADPAQWRCLVAVALAGLILVLTITKTGTYVNTVALAEPPLVALGVAGVVWLWRRAPDAPRRRLGLVAVGAAAALVAVQIVSFLARPMDPGLFVRPFSAPAHGWTASDSAVRRAAAATRGCPPGRPYSGAPYFAFVARRPMPGDEPDQFLLTRTRVGAVALPKVAAAPPVCP